MLGEQRSLGMSGLHGLGIACFCLVLCIIVLHGLWDTKDLKLLSLIGTIQLLISVPV